MSKSIGEIVKQAREQKNMTREDLARKLDISEGYMGHIERNSPVRISPRVVMSIKRVLRKSLSPKMVDKHNEKSRKWYRNYRKNNAA